MAQDRRVRVATGPGRTVRATWEHVFVRWDSLKIEMEPAAGEATPLPGYKDDAVVRRFDAPEALGLDVVCRGLAMVRSDDEVLQAAGALFDGLYEYRRRALVLGRDPS